MRFQKWEKQTQRLRPMTLIVAPPAVDEQSAQIAITEKDDSWYRVISDILTLLIFVIMACGLVMLYRADVFFPVVKAAPATAAKPGCESGYVEYQASPTVTICAKAGQDLGAGIKSKWTPKP